MYSQKHDEQGTINLFQMDYLPILIDSFLVDRKAQGLSGETIGKMKLRAPTVRGYKSWPGMHSRLLLAASQLASPFVPQQTLFVPPFSPFPPPSLLRRQYCKTIAF